MSEISPETAQEALALSAVILADAGLEVSADSLATLTTKAGLELESIWGQIYAKALEGQDLQKALINFNIPQGAAIGGAAPAAGAAAGSEESAAAAEEEEEEEEESDDDMGMGLFD